MGQEGQQGPCKSLILPVSQDFVSAANAMATYKVRDHPFKTSACSRGGGVKNLPNLPTDSTKKLPTVGG